MSGLNYWYQSRLSLIVYNSLFSFNMAITITFLCRIMDPHRRYAVTSVVAAIINKYCLFFDINKIRQPLLPSDTQLVKKLLVASRWYVLSVSNHTPSPFWERSFRCIFLFFKKITLWVISKSSFDVSLCSLSCSSNCLFIFSRST